MFASAWQLLTAIFFLSALTKLIYKLIKEADRRPASSHHQHQAATTFQQAAPVEPEVEAESHLERAFEQLQQLRHRRSSLTQISWSSPASPSSSSLSSSSTWTSLNSWASGRQSLQQQQQQQRLQQEAQDSDEEELVFEEALTFVLSQASGGPTLGQLEEERRLQEARWLTRQLFRRQLNRLAADQSASQSEPLEELGEEEAEVGEDLSHREGRALEEDGDEKRAHTSEPSENFDFASINFEDAHSLSGSSEATSSSASSDRKWTTLNLSYLIAEVFLLEPVKLTLNILSGTFAIFCGFLDFIEGIEHSAPDESGPGRGQAGSRSRQATSLPTRGANQSHSYPKRAATAAQQVTRQRETRGQVEALQQQQQRQERRQQQQEAGPERRSNYFHRRYFSRRSLSAALLSDDQDQAAAWDPIS